jgi:hypothetical protein
LTREFPEKVKVERTPWTENLFKVDTNSPGLSKSRREEFHTFVAKGLFLCKRARQDIQPAISFLSTRVKDPTQDDWNKLKRMIGFLEKTKEDVLTLEAHPDMKIEWFVDAAFAVHNDFKGHTGAAMTIGKGCIQAVSTKQKVNARSSTEAELIALDDVISKILWTKRFLEHQGIKIRDNIVYRDNLSSMKLEENGLLTAGKRSRHLDIKYFYVKDLISKGVNNKTLWDRSHAG